eukprot:sb/3473336/
MSECDRFEYSLAGKHSIMEHNAIIILVLRPSLSEGLSPISEGQEDYLQDSFNSCSSTVKETDGEIPTATATPADLTGDEGGDQTGDEGDHPIEGDVPQNEDAEEPAADNLNETTKETEEDFDLVVATEESTADNTEPVAESEPVQVPEAAEN